jgi:hypothetical protein
LYNIFVIVRWSLYPHMSFPIMSIIIFKFLIILILFYEFLPQYVSKKIVKLKMILNMSKHVVLYNKCVWTDFSFILANIHQLLKSFQY